MGTSVIAEMQSTWLILRRTPTARPFARATNPSIVGAVGASWSISR